MEEDLVRGHRMGQRFRNRWKATENPWERVQLNDLSTKEHKQIEAARKLGSVNRHVDDELLHIFGFVPRPSHRRLISFQRNREKKRKLVQKAKGIIQGKALETVGKGKATMASKKLKKVLPKFGRWVTIPESFLKIVPTKRPKITIEILKDCAAQKVIPEVVDLCRLCLLAIRTQARSPSGLKIIATSHLNFRATYSGI
ncbi:hypothetical protein ACOSP7_024326 [Xanthoceras sorbifolium]